MLKSELRISVNNSKKKTDDEKTQQKQTIKYLKYRSNSDGGYGDHDDGKIDEKVFAMKSSNKNVPSFYYRLKRLWHEPKLFGKKGTRIGSVNAKTIV